MPNQTNNNARKPNIGYLITHLPPIDNNLYLALKALSAALNSDDPDTLIEITHA